MGNNITNANAETDSMTALDNLKKEACSLNDKMEQAIIKIVKENGQWLVDDFTLPD